MRLRCDLRQSAMVRHSRSALTTHVKDWRYTHQGPRYETASGLVDDRNRVYSPTLGRFMQPDPDGYPDGANRFRIYLDNPVDYVDPLGLAGIKLVGGTYKGLQFDKGWDYFIEYQLSQDAAGKVMYQRVHQHADIYHDGKVVRQLNKDVWELAVVGPEGLFGDTLEEGIAKSALVFANVDNCTYLSATSRYDLYIFGSATVNISNAGAEREVAYDGVTHGGVPLPGGEHNPANQQITMVTILGSDGEPIKMESGKPRPPKVTRKPANDNSGDFTSFKGKDLLYSWSHTDHFEYAVKNGAPDPATKKGSITFAGVDPAVATQLNRTYPVS